MRTTHTHPSDAPSTGTLDTQDNPAPHHPGRRPAALPHADKGRARKHSILVRLSDAELQQWNAIRSRMALSQEEFARRRLLGRRLPAPTNHLAIHRLSRLAQLLTGDARAELIDVITMLA